jgi:hypothetical protein
MNTRHFDKYSETALMPFVEKLMDDYYDNIERLCDTAQKQADKVAKLEMNRSGSQYTTLCHDIIQEAGQHIQNRKDKYIPYIHQLSDKVVTQHDCSFCSGGCKMNHISQPLELKASNETMRKMVNRLQMVSLPLYAETIYPDEYRILRNQMALLENNLTELFFLENTYLIPKILEAQKNINVASS